MPRSLALLLVGLSGCFVDTGADDTAQATTASPTTTTTSPTTTDASSGASTTTTGTSSSSSTGVLTGDPPACGDGLLDPAEQCDDGNAIDDDACSNACRLATCKDGVQNGDETGIDCGGLCPGCLLCDPLVQDCPAGEQCIPGPTDIACAPDASGETGKFNDPCEFANVCDPGLLCINSDQATAACDQNIPGCCQPFCAYPDQACPNPDQTCRQYFDPTTLAPDDPRLKIGACQLMQ